MKNRNNREPYLKLKPYPIQPHKIRPTIDEKAPMVAPKKYPLDTITTIVGIEINRSVQSKTMTIKIT